MLGGAPEAHEVLSKTPRIEILLHPKTLPEAFPIKASDNPGVVAWWLELKNAEVRRSREPSRSDSEQQRPASVISTQLPAHVDATLLPVARGGAS
jgi:hypothetical protein